MIDGLTREYIGASANKTDKDARLDHSNFLITLLTITASVHFASRKLHHIYSRVGIVENFCCDVKSYGLIVDNWSQFITDMKPFVLL